MPAATFATEESPVAGPPLEIARSLHPGGWRIPEAQQLPALSWSDRAVMGYEGLDHLGVADRVQAPGSGVRGLAEQILGNPLRQMEGRRFRSTLPLQET